MNMIAIEKAIFEALDRELGRGIDRHNEFARGIVAACRVMQSAMEAETIVLQKQINDLQLRLTKRDEEDEQVEYLSNATRRGNEVHRELQQQFDMDRAWQCANRSCPPKAPTRGTTAPKCYTCDRPMVPTGQAPAWHNSSPNEILLDLAQIATLKGTNPCREINVDRAKHEIAKLDKEHPQIAQYHEWVRCGLLTPEQAYEAYEAKRPLLVVKEHPIGTHVCIIEALLRVQGVARVDVTSDRPGVVMIDVGLKPGELVKMWHGNVQEALRRTVAASVQVHVQYRYSTP